MSAILQVLLSGVATGCVYGLVALSFVLIYKATGSVSFMQGELLMLGAFVALALNVAVGMPIGWSVVATIMLLALLGALLERSVLHRALGQPHLTALLLTFGVGLIARGAVTAVPAASQTMHRLDLPLVGEVLMLGGVVFAVEHLMVILVTLVAAFGLAVFFTRSSAGLALRACSENPQVAQLLGVSVTRMHTLAWALGAALAALAGLLLAPVTFVHVNMGHIALKAFPAAVLGGMTSLPGALVAGVLLGVVEACAGLLLPDGVKDMVPYLVLMGALLLFPAGLAGRRGAR